MANALHPDRMTAAERLDEVASILGAGIRRLLAKHNKHNGIRVRFPGLLRHAERAWSGNP